MIRRPPRSTLSSSSAASDVYKRQVSTQSTGNPVMIHGSHDVGAHRPFPGPRGQAMAIFAAAHQLHHTTPTAYCNRRQELIRGRAEGDLVLAERRQWRLERDLEQLDRAVVGRSEASILHADRLELHAERVGLLHQLERKLAAEEVLPGRVLLPKRPVDERGGQVVQDRPW
eukprot:TRINITY_DN5304_c0_g1_i1.p1 TRINITY_DN5304_c0_g1~~TRINITY_DN5304_c0_g1_i1.p1  ORF type:complete len:171 (-),score=39.77 TRINITY_DN5304_c0_g1_i1:557-1069(-)